MKKMSVFILVLLLAISLVACGRRNQSDASIPSADTSETDMTILPDMDPTIDTNIPDPNVDTKMPIYTDGTDPTDASSRSGNYATGTH